jgi:hypothetical protein
VGDGEKVEAVDRSRSSSGRLTGGAAWKAHATLAVGLALCIGAFWLEIGRALQGNSLSWAYVFEWPLLGCFAIYMWWKVIHPVAPGEEQSARKKQPQIAPEFDGMLAAWQTHQEELAQSREAPPSSETNKP